MPKTANQKLKLLCLYEILLRRSDEEHPLTVPELIRALDEMGIRSERKSIYSDLQALADHGVDVQSRKERPAGWFIGQRQFELAELKLLVDAVQSSCFITRRKSDALIRKLETLASLHQASQLQRQVYVDRRVKTMNESIYYNVDALHTAISRAREITFRYFDYDISKQKVFRHDGAQYRVSPYSLVWNSENYYLVAYDDTQGQMRHYRVDKMSDIAVTQARRQGPAAFDVADYARRHFGMFGGTEASVTLRFDRRLVGVVLDRFGQDVLLIPDGEEHFTVTLPLVVSPQFFGWLFGLGDAVKLLGPPAAVQALRDQISAVEKLYR